MKRLLLLDTNVLVYIVQELYDADKVSAYKVFEYLALEYRECWIPKTVKTEFLRGKRYNTLYKRLRKLEDLSFTDIKLCPVTVNTHEIRLLVSSDNRDLGEGDAILQMTKARHQEKYGHHHFVFCTRDRRAQALAENMELEVMPYDSLKNRLKEVGIAIP